MIPILALLGFSPVLLLILFVLGLLLGLPLGLLIGPWWVERRYGRPPK